MTGKRYYITTLADWHRHASRFSNSHWFALDAMEAANGDARGITPSERADSNPPIIVIVEADEGAHLTLEDHPGFEPLPHPFDQKPISSKAQAALASFGLHSGATTLEVGEALTRFHPLLRHRVF